MKYMLDTNICIFLIKHKSETVIEHLNLYEPEDIGISIITYGELEYGVQKSSFPDRNEIALSLFLANLQILPLDVHAAEEYGRIRANLEKKGTPIGPNDYLIAAHALSEKCTLVTNNTKEFRRIEGLQIEDWTK